MCSSDLSERENLLGFVEWRYILPNESGPLLMILLEIMLKTRWHVFLSADILLRFLQSPAATQHPNLPPPDRQRLIDRLTKASEPDVVFRRLRATASPGANVSSVASPAADPAPFESPNQVTLDSDEHPNSLSLHALRKFLLAPVSTATSPMVLYDYIFYESGLKKLTLKEIMALVALFTCPLHDLCLTDSRLLNALMKHIIPGSVFNKIQRSQALANSEDHDEQIGRAHV